MVQVSSMSMVIICFVNCCVWIVLSRSLLLNNLFIVGTYRTGCARIDSLVKRNVLLDIDRLRLSSFMGMKLDTPSLCKRLVFKISWSQSNLYDQPTHFLGSFLGWHPQKQKYSLLHHLFVHLKYGECLSMNLNLRVPRNTYYLRRVVIICWAIYKEYTTLPAGAACRLRGYSTWIGGIKRLLTVT